MNNRPINWNDILGISSFYKTHKISFTDICAGRLGNVEYNFALLARHYLNVDVSSYDNLELIKNKVISALSWDLNTWDLYVEPLVFDEKVALECALIPFSFREVKLLSLTGHRAYFNYRIDAYEVLTCGRMNKDSGYFKKNEKPYFRYIVGEEVYQRIVLTLEAS